jgi:hypothetical protein
MYDDRTATRNYPLPHEDNYLDEDAGRLRGALEAIDHDVEDLNQGIDETNKKIENEATELSQFINNTVQAIDEKLLKKADLVKGLVPLNQLPVEHLGKIDVTPEFGEDTGQSAYTMPETPHKFILVPELGIFCFYEESVDPADGETCILPHDGSGRWHLIVPSTEFMLAWLEKREVLSSTAALMFGSVAAYNSADRTMPLAGAVVGDVCVVTPPALVAGLICTAWVSETGIVTVRIGNIRNTSITPATADFTVWILK